MRFGHLTQNRPENNLAKWSHGLSCESKCASGFLRFLPGIELQHHIGVLGEPFHAGEFAVHDCVLEDGLVHRVADFTNFGLVGVDSQPFHEVCAVGVLASCFVPGVHQGGGL